jgi:hypothetical protein
MGKEFRAPIHIATESTAEDSCNNVYGGGTIDSKLNCWIP